MLTPPDKGYLLPQSKIKLHLSSDSVNWTALPVTSDKFGVEVENTRNPKLMAGEMTISFQS